MTAPNVNSFFQNFSALVGLRNQQAQLRQQAEFQSGQKYQTFVDLLKNIPTKEARSAAAQSLASQAGLDLATLTSLVEAVPNSVGTTQAKMVAEGAPLLPAEAMREVVERTLGGPGAAGSATGAAVAAALPVGSPEALRAGQIATGLSLSEPQVQQGKQFNASLELNRDQLDASVTQAESNDAIKLQQLSQQGAELGMRLSMMKKQADIDNGGMISPSDRINILKELNEMTQFMTKTNMSTETQEEFLKQRYMLYKLLNSGLPVNEEYLWSQAIAGVDPKSFTPGFRSLLPTNFMARVLGAKQGLK